MKIRASVGAFALVLPSLAVAQVASEMPAHYRAVLDSLGRQGDFKDGVLKVNIPRGDLAATLAAGVRAALDHTPEAK